jgi:hypothetical protein
MKLLLEQIERAANRPGLAQALEFALEPDILDSSRPRERLVSGKTLFVRQDIRGLQPVEALSGMDTLNVEFRADGRYLARAEVAFSGAISTHDMTAIAVRAVSVSVFLKQSGVLRRPRLWLHAFIAVFTAVARRMSSKATIASCRRRP